MDWGSSPRSYRMLERNYGFVVCLFALGVSDMMRNRKEGWEGCQLKSFTPGRAQHLCSKDTGALLAVDAVSSRSQATLCISSRSRWPKGANEGEHKSAGSTGVFLTPLPKRALQGQQGRPGEGLSVGRRAMYLADISKFAAASVTKRRTTRSTNAKKNLESHLMGAGKRPSI